jgi:hypothetical protein
MGYVSKIWNRNSRILNPGNRREWPVDYLLLVKELLMTKVGWNPEPVLDTTVAMKKSYPNRE